VFELTGLESNKMSESDDQFSDVNGVDNQVKFDPSQLDIKTSTPSLDLMMSKIRNADIIFDLDFQRHDRIWKDEDKSALIESILLKIPIPVFYMSANTTDEWLVIDGLMRLTTMYDFVSDLFALKGLKILIEYNGLKFSQFPRSIARRIKETELMVHVIQPSTPKEATLEIFQRLNTKMVSLSSQEIRSSLNVGSATRFLRVLAESDEFIAATQGKLSPNRMEDIEYVLRFCAFYLEGDITNVNIKTTDDYLTNTMMSLNKEAENSSLLSDLSRGFFVAMKYVKPLFDSIAFKDENSKIPMNVHNKLLFETLAVILAHLPLIDLEKLILNTDKLAVHFKPLILAQTDQREAICARYLSIDHLIQKVLSDA
jgi:hypothetical protein